MRLSFVGELGWELHTPKQSCVPVYQAVMTAGAKHGLVNAGYRAIDSLSIEKGEPGVRRARATGLEPCWRQRRCGLHIWHPSYPMTLSTSPHTVHFPKPPLKTHELGVPRRPRDSAGMSDTGTQWGGVMGACPVVWGQGPVLGLGSASSVAEGVSRGPVTGPLPNTSSPWCGCLVQGH